MHERRFSAAHAHRLEDPERKIWLPPAEVMRALALQPGETAADLGAGTGYFALPMAVAVGQAGKIYAVDAQTEMLALLKSKLDREGLANVELVHAEAERTGLPEASCDLYFLANVWHELEDWAAAAREARRVLKTGGRVAILDWRPDVDAENGPPLAHRVDPSHASGYLLAAGFQLADAVMVGRYSWLLQARA